jgi:hypothetical protein
MAIVLVLLFAVGLFLFYPGIARALVGLTLGLALLVAVGGVGLLGYALYCHLAGPPPSVEKTVLAQRAEAAYASKQHWVATHTPSAVAALSDADLITLWFHLRDSSPSSWTLVLASHQYQMWKAASDLKTARGL